MILTRPGRGNEELESWLLRLLAPKIDFRFFTVEVDGRTVVLLEIARAARHPVRFAGEGCFSHRQVLEVQ